MAFSVPVFPLVCDVYRGPWVSRALAFSTPANLAFGRRVGFAETELIPQLQPLVNIYQLLLPAVTDVRDFSNAITPDVVEVPAGSGRWYGVGSVDDVGKGFSNEYRLVIITKIYEQLDPAAYPGLFWPVPIP
jgi:hypothetical protein